MGEGLPSQPAPVSGPAEPHQQLCCGEEGIPRTHEEACKDREPSASGPGGLQDWFPKKSETKADKYERLLQLKEENCPLQAQAMIATPQAGCICVGPSPKVLSCLHCGSKALFGHILQRSYQDGCLKEPPVQSLQSCSERLSQAS